MFEHEAVVSRFFQIEAVGLALSLADAVVIAGDSLRTNDHPDELIRHELAHLFSATWGKPEPPFKDEGLATWLQQQEEGESIDLQALAIVLGQGCPPLWGFIKPAHFHANRAIGYSLAGSFTGFLIRRFGWETYGRFFRTSSTRSLEADFARVFGLSLLAADGQWRRELLARRQEFEPGLSTRLSEHRARAAYYSWRLVDCLAACEAMDAALRAKAEFQDLAARAHFWLGRYQESIAIQERLVQDKDSDPVNSAARWFFLGMTYDLMNERAQAKRSYEQALLRPDCWDETDGSTHALARRHLRRPFCEGKLRADLLRYFAS